MFVPLPGRSGVHGALGFLAAESRRRYSRSDLALAEDLGRRAGMAIDNARLFEAEKGARRRSDLLQRVASGLSRALTAVDAARVVVTEARLAAGADASLVWLLDEKESVLELVAGEGYGTADVPDSVGAMQTFGRVPLEADLPLCDSVRRQAPVFLESPAARVARYPTIGPAAGTGFKAWAILPLLTQGRVVGGASLAFTSRARSARRTRRSWRPSASRRRRPSPAPGCSKRSRPRARPPRPRTPRWPSCTG